MSRPASARASCFSASVIGSGVGVLMCGRGAQVGLSSFGLQAQIETIGISHCRLLSGRPSPSPCLAPCLALSWRLGASWGHRGGVRELAPTDRWEGSKPRRLSRHPEPGRVRGSPRRPEPRRPAARAPTRPLGGLAWSCPDSSPGRDAERPDRRPRAEPDAPTAPAPPRPRRGRRPRPTPPSPSGDFDLPPRAKISQFSKMLTSFRLPAQSLKNDQSNP
jgi:hypothetical protein